MRPLVAFRSTVFAYETMTVNGQFAVAASLSPGLENFSGKFREAFRHVRFVRFAPEARILEKPFARIGLIPVGTDSSSRPDMVVLTDKTKSWRDVVPFGFDPVLLYLGDANQDDMPKGLPAVEVVASPELGEQAYVFSVLCDAGRGSVLGDYAIAAAFLLGARRVYRREVERDVAV